MWLAASAGNGPLGTPLAEMTCTLPGGGCSQTFAGGSAVSMLGVSHGRQSKRATATIAAAAGISHVGVVLNAVRAQAGGYYNRNIKTYYAYQNGYDGK